MPQTIYLWRAIKPAELPKKRLQKQVLRWRMNEESAAAYGAREGVTMEKVEGSAMVLSGPDIYTSDFLRGKPD